VSLFHCVTVARVRTTTLGTGQLRLQQEPLPLPLRLQPGATAPIALVTNRYCPVLFSTVVYSAVHIQVLYGVYSTVHSP